MLIAKYKYKCCDECFVPGPTGASGASGIRGIIGNRGIRGIQGIPGIPGITGPQGPQGIQGIDGNIGSKGDEGHFGPTGRFESDYLYWHASTNQLVSESGGTAGSVHLGSFSLQNYLLTPGLTGSNTAIGTSVLKNNTSTLNTGIGTDAMINKTSGFSNTAIGYQSLLSATSSIITTAIGSQSLYSNNNISGISTSSGYQSLYHDSSTRNTAHGYMALFNNTSGTSNTACGSESQKCVMDANGSANGSANTTSGYQSLFSNTSGSNNTLSGVQSLYNNMSGTQNTAFGYQSMFSNVDGNNNAVIGYGSLYSNVSRESNTVCGATALSNNVGYDNTIVGYNAFSANISGSKNTSIGANTIIPAAANNLTYATAIGADAIVGASSTIQLGHPGLLSLKCSQSLTITSDLRVKNNIVEDIKGLDFVRLLRPVSYKRADIESKPESEVIYNGLIAQELYEAAKQTNFTSFSGVIQGNEDKLWEVCITDLIPCLIKSIQELENKKYEIEKSKESIQCIYDSLRT